MLKILFVILLFSFQIKGIINFDYLESIVLFVFFIVSAIYYIRSLLFQKVSKFILYNLLLFLFLIFIIFIHSLVNHFDKIYTPSVLYEVYKLFTPFCFIPIFVLMIRGEINFIINILIIFLLINMIALIAQYIFGVGIIKYFGVFQDVGHYISRNRPTGITANANIIGSFSVFIFIFTKTYYYELKGMVKNNSKIFWLLSLSLSVTLLSSSKASYLCLVLFLILTGLSLRKIILSISFSFSFLYVALFFNVFKIKDKLYSYYDFLGLISHTSAIKESQIEGRLWAWYNAITLFKNDLLGYGFGTWGDFSSRINVNLTSFNNYIDFSDSSLSHLLVEQGVFTFLYFYILYRLLNYVPNKVPIIVIIFFMTITTYGFSQFLFYIGFWLLVSFSLYKQKGNKSGNTFS